MFGKLVGKNQVPLEPDKNGRYFTRYTFTIQLAEIRYTSL